MLIYKILNTINNKIYIGCTTKTIEERFNKHWARRKDKTPMARALMKYGKEIFNKEVIEICINKEEMFEREKYWIIYYKSNNRAYGYNATEGGDSGPVMYGSQNPSFGKKNLKLSELNKNRKGNKVSDKTKELISIKTKESWENGKFDNSIEIMSKKRKEAWENGKYDNVGEKISAAKKGVKTKKRISIICLNNNKVYDCYSDAATELNLFASNISCVINGKFKHTKGFMFIKNDNNIKIKIKTYEL